MPEEINRIVTDAISDLLFTSEPSANDNLRREGRPADAIHFVGNTMIDTLLRSRERAERSTVLDRLGLSSDPSKGAAPYAVLTLHRPSNVDREQALSVLLDAIARVACEVPIIFPVHPRTAGRIEAFGFADRLVYVGGGQSVGASGLFAVPPLGYIDFLKLIASARLVLTDSGGIQEETTILGVPCVTLRENTERPITVEQGTNTLVGRVPERIVRASLHALSLANRTAERPPRWDGKAGARIVDVLSQSPTA